MPFKDSAEGKTHNIYTSWFMTAGEKCHGDGMITWLRDLDDFTLDELNHLKWLIEQEIEGRDAKTNS